MKLKSYHNVGILPEGADEPSIKNAEYQDGPKTPTQTELHAAFMAAEDVFRNWFDVAEHNIGRAALKVIVEKASACIDD